MRSELSEKNIWAVAGGKGGTGKSLIAASLGILLSKMNNKVVVIDADLGGANLHTYLNVNTPKASLSDFVQRKVKRLDDIVTVTSFEKLKLISGAADTFNIANPVYFQKKRLLTHIKRLPYDQIIIDLGAGSSLNVLDFFNLSNIGIVIALPEPSSVENLYRFVKASFMRFVRSHIVGTELKSLYQLLHRYYADTKGTDFLRNTKEVLEIIKRYDKDIYFKIKEGLENFQLKLIINQVREREDIELGDSIEKMVIKHLGIGMSFVGYIPYDDRVYKSAKRFRPFLSEYPESSTVSCMDGIACKLLNGHRLDDNDRHLRATS